MVSVSVCRPPTRRRGAHFCCVAAIAAQHDTPMTAEGSELCGQRPGGLPHPRPDLRQRLVHHLVHVQILIRPAPADERDRPASRRPAPCSAHRPPDTARQRSSPDSTAPDRSPGSRTVPPASPSSAGRAAPAGPAAGDQVVSRVNGPSSVKFTVAAPPARGPAIRAS